MEVCSHNQSDPNTVLLKINGTACNLSCDYCSEIKKNFTNTIDLNELIRLFKSLPSDVEIILHGGEPLLNLEYVRKAIALFRRYRPLKKISLQTNGCLSDDMRHLLLDNSDILRIGVSIDGPAPLNKSRSDANNNPSFERTDETISFFEKNGIFIKCIATINAYNVQSPVDVLDYFLSHQNIKQIRFNPCFDMSGEVLTTYAVKPHQFLEFLLGIERIWLRKKIYRGIRIDPLQAELEDELANQLKDDRRTGSRLLDESLLNYPTETSRITCKNCCKFVSIYPNHKYTICDALGIEEFEVVDLSRVFNHAESSLQSSLLRPCEQCKFFGDCGGGCVAIFRRFRNSPDLIEEYCDYRRVFKREIRNLVNTKWV